METKTKCSNLAMWPVKIGHCITDIRPHAAQKVPVRGHSSSFFLISFPDLWLTSPLHVMTWHMRDDVAVVWTSTALRANRYSCTLVWAEWVRAHEGWRKDGFGRELDPQSCTTGKFIPVCGRSLLSLRAIFQISYFCTFDKSVLRVVSQCKIRIAHV